MIPQGLCIPWAYLSYQIHPPPYGWLAYLFGYNCCYNITLNPIESSGFFQHNLEYTNTQSLVVSYDIYCAAGAGGVPGGVPRRITPQITPRDYNQKLIYSFLVSLLRCSGVGSYQFFLVGNPLKTNDNQKKSRINQK